MAAYVQVDPTLVARNYITPEDVTCARLRAAVTEAQIVALQVATRWFRTSDLPIDTAAQTGLMSSRSRTGQMSNLRPNRSGSPYRAELEQARICRLVPDGGPNVL